MAQKVIVSPLNTFALRTVDPQRPARYHRGHLDTEWQRDLVMSFQTAAYYLQKVERGDRFRFQFKATTNISHSLKLLDCSGKTVLTFTQTATADLPGDLTADGSQLHTYYYKLANLAAVTADGTYYLLLTVNHDGTIIEQLISEPIALAATHPDTMLLEYSHSENKSDVLFEQLPVRFPLRVEAYIAAMEPVSSDTVYEDQAMNVDLLDSTAYRNWTLFVGQTGDGLPDWLLDKLNRVMSLDSALLDGKQYRKSGEGAKWNVQRSEIYPLSAADISIREADNTAGFEFGKRTIVVATLPAPPYAISTMQLDNYVVASAKVVGDATAETAFIAALNAAVGDLELFGTYAKVSGKLVYTLADSDTVSIGNATIFTTRATVTLTTPGSIPPYVFAFDTTQSNMVVEWGDGVVTNERANQRLTAFTTHVHTYPGAPATYSVKLWGPIKGLILYDGNITNLTGPLPVGLAILSTPGIRYAGNSFNFNLLAPCQATIQELNISYCGLTAAPNANSYVFPKLSNWNFSGNSLNSATVSAFMYDVHRNTSLAGIYGGTFSIVAQSPAATLTGSGNYYKSLLITNYSWTVNS